MAKKKKRRSKRNWEHGHRSRQAAKAAHPRLNPSATIRLADVLQLKAIDFINYAKLEYVECRLERDGRVCETEHGRGILVEAPGDVVSHVGWCCYEDYLEQHVEFRATVVSRDREYKSADLKQRLGKYLEDPTFHDRVEALRSERWRVELRLNHIKSSIPPNMLRRLDEVRQSASHQVAIRVFRQQRDATGNELRDEDHKPVVKSERVVVGQFSGLRAFEHSRFGELVESFTAIALAVEKAQETAEPSPNKVDRWVQSFDRLPNAERIASRINADLDAFMKADNLELLRFVAHYVGQPSLAFIAVARLRGKLDLSQAAAEREAYDWIAAMCTSHRCDRFESHSV